MPFGKERNFHLYKLSKLDPFTFIIRLLSGQIRALVQSLLFAFSETAQDKHASIFKQLFQEYMQLT